MKVFRTLLSAIVILFLIAGILIGVLVHRGFRATAVPLPFEAALANHLRNAAIPRDEREKRNPITATSEVIEQGREVFLNRCAVCHGIDGSAKERVSNNLYPRVPDLRSPTTQSLTDGELHYIIENGVQFTGMPAWGNAHAETPADNWKLVLFIRNLRMAQPVPDAVRATSQTPVASAQYVGSRACGKCHSEIYERWKITPMANVVRDPREHPGAIIPDLNTNSIARFDRSQIALVYGSIWKQRYFTKVGEDYFPMRAQWDIGNHVWRPYLVPSKGGDWWGAVYPSDNMERPTGPTCDGCHSVNYDIHTRQVTEWNVGCERCHGPGSDHVAAPSRRNILNPDQLDSTAQTDSCIQCHSQGQPLGNPIAGKYFDWPVGYNIGLKLQDYWKLESCTLGETSFYYFPDCTAHKNRMQGNDFVQSVMYRHGIMCSSCHDVHGTQNYAQLRKPGSQICLDCHGPKSPNGPHTATLEEHTHHKSGSTGSDCVACHMPAIETEGVPGAFVHAHTFRFISPEMTDKYKIPNPCTSCHKDKSTAWASDSLKQWPEHSPWSPLL